MYWLNRRHFFPVHPELVLRLLRTDDIALAMELKRLAGWNQTASDWVGYLEFDPEGCFAADYAGKTIGTATTVGYGDRFGWIGMVLVHPEARRQGAGTRLLRRAIEHLQQRGVGCAKLDATDMGMKVYLPMGFKAEYRVTRFEGIARASVTRRREPGSDALRDGVELRPLTVADLAGIEPLDTRAFGASRPVILRSLRERNPDFNYVARDASGVRGYVIAREGENAIQLGPWTADSVAVAAALLDRCFQQGDGRKVFLDVPEPNAPALALVRERGFTVQRGFTRMYLGENRHPGHPKLVFGTSGAEKG